MKLLNEIGDRYPIRDVSIQEVSIEDVIRKLYLQTGQHAPDEGELDTWTRHRAVTQ
jgi:ABC-type uncharacterized transport system ATPase subunit